MLLRNYILLLLIVLSNTKINAQKKTKDIDRYIAFGPTITSYKGDLNSSYSNMNGGIHLMIIPEKDKLIQTSLELNIGRVVGENHRYYSLSHPTLQPNTFFQTNYSSFSLNIRAYLIRKENVKVYIGQGFGAIRYTPKDAYGNKFSDSISTRHSSERSYRNLSIILPRTLGVAYKLKNGYQVSLDINQQAPRTDYIDNISVLGEEKRKKDKILQCRFSILIPITYKKEEVSAIQNESTE